MVQIGERRKHSRSGVRWPITIWADHGTIEGETRDISIGGMAVRCDEPLHLNEVFRIAILPPDHKAIGVSGKVVWSDHYAIDRDDSAVGLGRLGLSFVDISDEDRTVFEDALTSLVLKRNKLNETASDAPPR